MQIRKIKNYLKKTYATLLKEAPLSQEDILEIKNSIAKVTALNHKINPFVAKIDRELQTEFSDEKIAIASSQIPLLDFKFDGSTLLIRASDKGFEEVVSELIKAKASLDIKNNLGDTALLYAVRRNHIKIMNELLTAKANVDIVEDGIKSALNEAISYGSLHAIRLLLEYHAKIQRPECLFKLLKKYDPRDPDVLFSLQELCRQYPINKRKRKKEQIPSPEHEYLEALLALEKEVVHRDLERKKIMDTIESALPTVPHVLVDLVASYRNAPLANISFFQSNEILTTLNQLKTHGLSCSTSFIQLEKVIKELRQLGQRFAQQYINDPAARALRNLLTNLITRVSDKELI